MAEKKRRKHTGLIVLALLLAALAALAYWQRNNIAALLAYTSAGSQEEIEQQMQQNQQAIDKAVEENPDIVVRDLTEEEKQALRDGTLTQEEVAERLTGGAAEETPKEEKPAEQPPKQEETPKQETPEAEQPKQEKPAGQQPEESEYQKQLSAVVAKVYVLREKFTIELDNLQAEAVAAYKALPEEEREGSKLIDFAKKYVLRAAELEKECDAEMDAIVAELDALVSANNGDYSVIDTVIETYASEKSLKKAWYMAELKKRGFV